MICYQIRLCPANESLTELCFQRQPLEFDRTKQQLRWNNGTRLSIPGTWVDTGTFPKGSTWAKNPVPRIDFGSGAPEKSTWTGSCRGKRGANCVNFKPSCEDSWDDVHPTDSTGGAVDDVQGQCSGDWTNGTIVSGIAQGWNWGL